MNRYNSILYAFSLFLFFTSLCPNISLAQGGSPPPPAPTPPRYLPGYGLGIGGGGYLSVGIKKVKNTSTFVVTVRITFNKPGQPSHDFKSIELASYDSRLSDIQRAKIRELLPKAKQIQNEISTLNEEVRAQSQKQKGIISNADLSKHDQRFRAIIQKHNSGFPGLVIDLGSM